MEQTIIRLAIGLVLLVAVNVVLGSLNALLTGLSTVSNAGTASLRDHYCRLFRRFLCSGTPEPRYCGNRH